MQVAVLSAEIERLKFDYVQIISNRAFNLQFMLPFYDACVPRVLFFCACFLMKFQLSRWKFFLETSIFYSVKTKHQNSFHMSFSAENILITLLWPFLESMYFQNVYIDKNTFYSCYFMSKNKHKKYIRMNFYAENV